MSDDTNNPGAFDITDSSLDINAVCTYLKDTAQFHLLNIFEKALVCSDIYDDSLDVFLEYQKCLKYSLPQNSYIRRLSDEETANKGLNPTLFRNVDSGFFSGLYYNARTSEYILAFRGTEGKRKLNGEQQTEAIKDWAYGNDPQTVGKKSPQYTQALELGDHIKEIMTNRYSITGHSLGGGLSAAVTVLLQKEGTITFNAAGLHRNTVKRYARSKGYENIPGPWASRHLITNYFVKGEIVTKAQRGGKAFLGIITGPFALLIVPLACGTSIKIDPADRSKTAMQRHQMSELINNFLIKHDIINSMNNG